MYDSFLLIFFLLLFVCILLFRRKERRKHVDVSARLSCSDIPIVNTDYKLVPAVCLYSSKKITDRETKPCVRANFIGPFRFPVHSNGLEFAPFGGTK